MAYVWNKCSLLLENERAAAEKKNKDRTEMSNLMDAPAYNNQFHSMGGVDGIVSIQLIYEWQLKIEMMTN